MRTAYNINIVNIPRTIAGIEWKPVVAISMFFGFAALMFKEPGVLIAPVVLIWFLRGPGLRDPDFLKIIKRHSSQRDFYSPAYISKVNLKTPRPQGFSRLDVL